MRPAVTRIFLLSPAHSGGLRARMLLRPEAKFELARRVQIGDAALGEVFAFCSGLYFRGKLAYARHFSRPPANAPGALVITPSRGLLPWDSLVDPACLREFASVPVDVSEPRYIESLTRSAAALARLDLDEVILLGSIATGKYVECLLPLLGERLRFPSDFVGRGDMSRGGLLLRCVAGNEELSYVPVLGAIRRGTRPQKLAPMRQTRKPDGA
jgi:hypothetical protein